MSKIDPFGARASLEAGGASVSYFALDVLQEQGLAQLDLMPVTIKVLLENLLRLAGTRFSSEDDVAFLAGWGRKPLEDREFAFAPARVILQDFTGVPAAVDLAAMRSAIARAGGEPREVDPLVPVDLVIDHSVQVDAFGGLGSYGFNVEREYERNAERYSLLRWAQQAFAGFRVVPPGMGIVHQVNLEYLAKVVQVTDTSEGPVAIPDTLVGTDSHTPMVNGLSVLGWGVGGIEAEAALLGQPLPMLTPQVVGFRFSGALGPGVTATDLVLTVTEILRAHGVVGKFVEFYGDGVSGLTVADRATLSNMSPEFGATASLWPVDHQTLAYLRLTGREDSLIELVESYTKHQGMFRTDDTPDPQFSETLELDLSSVVPSLAGPRRPQDRVPLGKVWESFTDVYSGELANGNGGVEIAVADLVAEGGNASGFDPTHEHPDTAPQPQSAEDAAAVSLRHGSVVIAAITSCTNTSNPPVMLAAGLLARKAAEKGLRAKPWVKTSLAPGSRVVTDYLENAGLLDDLEKLGFFVVGYGCTTCIGNSGPLPEAVSTAVDENDLAVVSVLSGNRNFEGRIHPQVKASYLASPPLVVAYALAGTADIDLGSDPLGTDRDGADVYLRDIWPSSEEIEAALLSVKSEFFGREYGKIFDGDEHWTQLPSPSGDLYEWDAGSSYVREPSFFENLGPEPAALGDVVGARVLVKVGDSVTTDHISPAGSIAPSSPAGKYLVDQGVKPADFNSYGSRRGNHEVMVRGTFANIRLRNDLVASGKAGGWTTLLPDGDETTIFEAAQTYMERGVPLIVIAGREYGSGSSRDWAAKGPLLLGVKAVIAESFERIHRSNLVAMGILPLQFVGGKDAASLGLKGDETYDIAGIEGGLEPHAELHVVAHREDGGDVDFDAECRIDSEVELDYFRNGGVLQLVLRRMLEHPREGSARSAER
ncbi:MAG: aconitate hydratase [Actinomycetota bacterium]|jgi:aconitate hydratase|nr:aconitate hydratase [Actinomycetota bacterium]